MDQGSTDHADNPIDDAKMALRAWTALQSQLAPSTLLAKIDI